MPKLTELGLTNEAVGQDISYADAPDQMGAFRDPPQPGTFRFRFPDKIDDIWDTFQYDKGAQPGQRLRATFDDTHPLVIIQSPGGTENGTPFETRISNAERKRGKRDDPTAVFMSDMDYIFRDVFGITEKPKTNGQYAQLALQHFPKAEMTADIEWSWHCNPTKNIRVADGQGGYQEVQQAGCDARYNQRDVLKIHADPNDPNSPLVYPSRIQCQCGASVRAFANLTRFRR